MRLSWTDRALAELESATLYYKLEAGVIISNHFLETVKSTSSLLEQHPEIGRQ